MKIALVETLSPGTADDSRGLARALTEAGHQVTAHPPVTGHDTGAADEHDPGAAVPRSAASLGAQWGRTRPDVVHATGWAAGLAALAAARELDIPVVESFGSLAITERQARAGPSAGAGPAGARDRPGRGRCRSPGAARKPRTWSGSASAAG